MYLSSIASNSFLLSSLHFYGECYIPPSRTPATSHHHSNRGTEGNNLLQSYRLHKNSQKILWFIQYSHAKHRRVLCKRHAVTTIILPCVAASRGKKSNQALWRKKGFLWWMPHKEKQPIEPYSCQRDNSGFFRTLQNYMISACAGSSKEICCRHETCCFCDRNNFRDGVFSRTDWIHISIFFFFSGYLLRHTAR